MYKKISSAFKFLSLRNQLHPIKIEEVQFTFENFSAFTAMCL